MPKIREYVCFSCLVVHDISVEDDFDEEVDDWLIGNPKGATNATEVEIDWSDSETDSSNLGMD